MWIIIEKFVRTCRYCVGQIFKVKVYTGVKFEISVNHVKTWTNIFLVSRKYILLPTSNISVLGYWQKGQRSGFDLYVGQKPKINQIWLKMIWNYSSQNELPKTEFCDNIIMLHYRSNKAIPWMNFDTLLSRSKLDTLFWFTFDTMYQIHFDTLKMYQIMIDDRKSYLNCMKWCEKVSNTNVSKTRQKVYLISCSI